MSSSATALSTDIEALYTRYAGTFATRDAAAISALHSPDSVFWQRTGRPPVHGREAVRAAFAALFTRWPDLSFEVHRVFFGERFWVLDWDLTATEGNHHLRLSCLDVVEVDSEGLVTSKHTWVDAA